MARTYGTPTSTNKLDDKYGQQFSFSGGKLNIAYAESQAVLIVLTPTVPLETALAGAVTDNLIGFDKGERLMFDKFLLTDEVSESIQDPSKVVSDIAPPPVRTGTETAYVYVFKRAFVMWILNDDAKVVSIAIGDPTHYDKTP